MVLAKEVWPFFRHVVKSFSIHPFPVVFLSKITTPASQPLRTLHHLGSISFLSASPSTPQGTNFCGATGIFQRRAFKLFDVRELSTERKITPLAKHRIPLRRVKRETQSNKGFSVSGFSTAEEYDLELVKTSLLKQQLYRQIENGIMSKIQETENSEPDVLHVVANYAVEEEPREIFIFREGTVIFWNVSELEIANLLRFIRPYELNSYDEKLVLDEQEVMSYVHSNSKKCALQGGMFHLSESVDNSLEKYTFSNAISLSVKLGIWEASLEEFIDSIEHITDDLKMGNKIVMSREEVLREQGELFALRHFINLSSDLLDTPDFYWDNDELESLFVQTVSYFSIARRTRVMNEKLNHCVELLELVSSHLNDKHHVRLEWMVIILIMVEVLFEILHFIK